MNLHGHPFWSLLALACLVWYSSVTIYVAIQGALDIRRMLARLARLEQDHPR